MLPLVLLIILGLILWRILWSVLETLWSVFGPPISYISGFFTWTVESAFHFGPLEVGLLLCSVAIGLLLFYRPREDNSYESYQGRTTTFKREVRDHTSWSEGVSPVRTPQPKPRNRQHFTTKTEAQLPAGTPGYYREEAIRHHNLRVECFENAKQAYNMGCGAEASDYSKQGHMHTREMNEANADAVRVLLNQRKQSIDKCHTLDLHGFFVSEVEEIVQRVLRKKQEALEQQQYGTNGCKQLVVTIITGKGNHSKGHLPKVRPALIDILNRKHYIFSEPEYGIFEVVLTGRR